MGFKSFPFSLFLLLDYSKYTAGPSSIYFVVLRIIMAWRRVSLDFLASKKMHREEEDGGFFSILLPPKLTRAIHLLLYVRENAVKSHTKGCVLAFENLSKENEGQSTV